MQEREVSLVNVLGEILRYWRGILVFLIVGMVMGGILGLGKNNSAELEIQVIPELSFFSKEKVKQLQAAEQEYQEEIKRYEESPLIAMENDVIWRGMLWYEAVNKSIAESVIADKLYEEENNKKNFLRIIPDIPDDALDDIISIPECDSDTAICIRIFSEDERTCLALMEEIKLSLDELATMDGVELKFIYEECSDRGKHFVRALQKQKYERIENLKKNVEDLKSQLSEEELLYYNVGDTEIVKDNQSNFKKVNVSYKMVIAGGMAGVFIYACYIGFRYLIDNKVKVEDDLQALYGISEIQTIIQKQSNQRILDRQLLKLRCRVLNLMDQNEAISIASKQIVTLTEKSKKPIAMWEWIKEEEKSDVVQALCDSLRNAGRECVAENSVMNSAEKIEKVASMETVVFVIQERIVTYQEILRAVNYLNRQQVQILGVIKLV